MNPKSINKLVKTRIQYLIFQNTNAHHILNYNIDVSNAADKQN